jgi:hypothetical protein
MRRSLSILVASLLVGLSLGVPAALAQGGPSVGTEVPFIDDQGVTRGTIVVKELNDPFTGIDPARPAAAGSRYVGLSLQFTAADDQQFDASPHYAVVRDTDGYLYNPQFVPRPADDPVPDLQAQTLAPGNRISGFVGYILPADAAIDDILYTYSSYFALPLVDVDPAPGPAQGQPVPFVASDGSQALFTLTVTDPFTDSGSPPAEGMRFVGLQAIVENTGATPFDANPSELYLRSATGGLYYPTGISRTDPTIPDLQSQPLSPGDRVSGFVGFSVPADATLVAVDLWPDSGRRARLADLTGGGPAPTVGPVVTPEPVPSVVPATLTPSPTPGQSAGVSQ